MHIGYRKILRFLRTGACDLVREIMANRYHGYPEPGKQIRASKFGTRLRIRGKEACRTWLELRCLRIHSAKKKLIVCRICPMASLCQNSSAETLISDLSPANTYTPVAEALSSKLGLNDALNGL